MASAEKENAPKDSRARLLWKARLVDALTFLAVILISPASVVLAFPLGVDPQAWLATWSTYVALLIVLAMALGVVGFSVSFGYRLEADRQQRDAAGGRQAT